MISLITHRVLPTTITLVLFLSSLVVIGTADTLPRPFQLRLHWTPGACWQGDCEGPHNGLARTTGWCWQCEGLRCNWGDLLWIEPCRQPSDLGGEGVPPEQLFRWIPIPLETIFAATTLAGDGTKQEWGQLQVRSQEVYEDGFGFNADGRFITYVYCLEHVRSTIYQLRECNAGRQSQWFRGLPADLGNNQALEDIVPFELHPSPKTSENDDIYAAFTSDQLSQTENNCMVMHHHPRQFEEIKHTTCQEARAVDTSLWELIPESLPNNSTILDDDMVAVNAQERPESPFPSFEPQDYYRIGDTRKNPACIPEATCGMCQGHCRNDDDCAGSLKCFERAFDNPYEVPPGCHGTGIARIDYCYAADGN